MYDKAIESLKTSLDFSDSILNKYRTSLWLARAEYEKKNYDDSLKHGVESLRYSLELKSKKQEFYAWHEISYSLLGGYKLLPGLEALFIAEYLSKQSSDSIINETLAVAKFITEHNILSRDELHNISNMALVQYQSNDAISVLENILVNSSIPSQQSEYKVVFERIY